MSDRARFQSTLVFEGREQDDWAAARDHAHAPWRELVALWRGFRLHIARVMEARLVGALGPESTIDYYRRILDARHAADPGSAPSLVIDSLDFQAGPRLVGSDLPGLTDYLLGSLRRLGIAVAAPAPAV